MQARLGMVLFYMFVERDTGPQDAWLCSSVLPFSAAS